jgi:hypothetical protein
LARIPASVFGCATEVVALKIGVPDVKHCASLHYRIGCGVGIPQELPELVVAHTVVLNG